MSVTEQDKMNNNDNPMNTSRKPIILDEFESKMSHEITNTVTKTPSIENLNQITNNEIKPLVQRIDVMKHIISTMAGKDKLAKIIKCVIDLIRLYILSPNNRITGYKQKFLPFKIIIYFVGLMRSILTVSSTKWISQQLNIFRYALRFGGTPFRTIDFMSCLANHYEKHGLSWKEWKKYILNEDTIQGVVDIYYGVFDELDLLYKLKILSNKKLYPIVTKHETIAWEYDILLGLKKNYKLLQANRQRQIELNLKLQTHNLLLNSPENSKQSSLSEEFALIEKARAMQNLLNELKYEQKLVKLDLARLTMDLLANSSDLFHWDRFLPKGSYAALSLVSGSFNIYKYWCVSKKQLENK